MPNKNYVKGRAKEYKIKKEFERRGYVVLRTAGSHGFADLVAIKEESGQIRFIQCKPDNFSEREERKLMEKYYLFNTPWMIWKSSFEVI